MRPRDLCFVLASLSSGCLMNWSALEPDGSAAAGAAGAGGGIAGAAGAGGGAGTAGKSGGAGGATGGTAGKSGGAGGTSGGAAGATGGAAGATGGAAGTTGGAAGAAGATGGAAGVGGDPAGGAAGAGGDPAGGAAGAGGDPAGGAAGAGGTSGVSCTEQGATSDPATGHCYFVLGGPGRSWTSARDACAMATPPAHLATITSQAEQDFIAALSLQQTCWIGLSGPLNALGWVTGETSTFTAWAPNQPNGSGNVCVRIDSASKLWNDDTCNKQQAVLCERE